MANVFGTGSSTSSASQPIDGVFNSTTKTRGCFSNMTIGTSNSLGARLKYDDGTSKGGAPFLTNGQAQDCILVTSVSYTQKEKVHVVQCFEDTNHIYAFGHDPTGSVFRVDYLLFLTAKDGSGSSDAFKRSLQSWGAQRISKSLKPVKLALGGAVMKGYLSSVNCSTRDVMINVQQCSYDFIVTEVQTGT